ncbi:NH(3)-dependent NAD(+) synthetase [Sporotomaculum syntrophicum]|uniref:NH(3)-dependent NAD(+) synthetase n=1 Tax=Sporotomaculum syntrophicum TaxID=182264 RepID=A0A9D2WQ45_9FIRM|nr:NAD(+) synthase [Sporotomaculum syntrophicum]KAF1085515.1 NH(3)-dependent NAD(+) synthetase [Sporotomaculum syntrophicum]
MSKDLNMEIIAEEIIAWIRQKLAATGGDKLIVSVLGDPESVVAAVLAVKAIGSENVYGIVMPNARQGNIGYAYTILEAYNIANVTLNYNNLAVVYYDMLSSLRGKLFKDYTRETIFSLPNRIKMTLLYAIAQSIPGSRILSTLNLTRRWIGYTTLYGDDFGTLAPLAGLTNTEVLEMERVLQLPPRRPQSQYDCGPSTKADESTELGFSYSTLNSYLREGQCKDAVIKAKIDQLHEATKYKFEPMSFYPSPLPILADDADA